MVMKRYSNSNVYPISQTAIDSIAANMKEHGFDPDFPIIVKDGEIVDGWHRYEAAKQAGVEPEFREFVGSAEDVLHYILRANGDRRHLWQGQKAAAAIIINRKLGSKAQAAENLAQSAGVNKATVDRLRSYSDDELEGIVSGEKSQSEVKEAKAKDTRSQATTYTLTRPQAAKVAALTVSMDQKGKQVLTKAFDLGLKALEDTVG